MTPVDFRRAAAFVAAIPPGRWASFGDVPEAGGSPKAARAVGQWLMREGDRVPGVHPVLRASGEVPPGFLPAGVGAAGQRFTPRDRR